MKMHRMKSPQSGFKKNSLLFFAISILFSWPIFFLIDAWVFPNLMKQGESVKALFFIMGGHVLGMFGPSVAGIVILKLILKIKLPSWKWSHAKYYLWGFIFMMSIWLLPAIIGIVISSFKVQTSFKTFQLVFIGIYIATVWFAGMGEEFGWCSFLLSYLSPEIGKTRAMIISGTFRGIWHFPILISPVLYKVIMGEQSVLNLVLFSVLFLAQLIISNILFGSLFGYVWYQTKSLPLIGWLHFIFDLARDFSMFFIIGYGKSVWGKFGWALIFYGFAYHCLEKVMRKEGIVNIFNFRF